MSPVERVDSVESLACGADGLAVGVVGEEREDFQEEIVCEKGEQWRRAHVCFGMNQESGGDEEEGEEGAGGGEAERLVGHGCWQWS